MGQDEYSEPKARSAMSLEAIALPLLVSLAAILFGLAALDGGVSVRAMASGFVALAEKNHILQAFLASSLIGLVSYVVMLASNALIARVRGRALRPHRPRHARAPRQSR